MADSAPAFLGKWTFHQQGLAVQAAASGAALSIGAAPTDGSDRFNAYGTAASFVLQSNAGTYVVVAGGGYAAKAPDASSANHFALQDVGEGIVRVVDLGSDPSKPGTNLWNNASGVLAPVSPASPPATTSFTKTEVTPGTAAIIQSGFTSPQPDLAWVDVSGVDFSVAGGISFTQSKLDHANFSDTAFAPGTAFDNSTAAGVDFSNATLDSCGFPGVDFTGAGSASFTGASMTSVDLNDAKLTGANLRGADLSGALNLASTVFDRADLTDVKLTDCGNIYQTTFVGATLVRTDFSGAMVTGPMDISGADLSGVNLSNEKGRPTIFGKQLVITSATRFRDAKLTYLDLSGKDLRNITFARADLTGCALESTQLDGADFGFATMTGVTVTGGVSMHGANLTSAKLEDADLSGAQLGAVGQLFRVGDDQSGYVGFLTALQDGDATTVTKVFAANGVQLIGTVVVRTSAFSSTTWQVQAPDATYNVVQERVGSTASLVVYLPTSAAVLSNAFMVNVNLKGANLYGVRASGAQLYATAGRSVNLNKATVDGLQVNNANLGNIDLSQANVAGVNFDYAMLTGADFTGATVAIDANGGQPSFNGANLQGAKFDAAQLHEVIFANAAVAVAAPNDPNSSAGVWLFSLDAQQAPLVVPQLDLGSAPLDGGSTGAQHVFTIPTAVLPQMLATGPAPQGVVASFKKAGIALAADALLVIFSTDLFWQLTDGTDSYVIFPSVSDRYQPALGVASGTDYTVAADAWIPLSIRQALANGTVAGQVVTALGAAGITVSAKATVTTAQYPLVWQIISGSDTYTAWLVFESTGAGVDTNLVVRAGIPNVISVFGGQSIALSMRASITRLAGGGWQIDNDADNPFSTASGYIVFKVFTRTDGGLDVYGSLIRVLRRSAPGVDEYVNVPCDITTLSKATLSAAGNTVCPNGATVAANTSGEVPFDQWLWARYLPSPPRCVPDPMGKFFCPT